MLHTPVCLRTLISPTSPQRKMRRNDAEDARATALTSSH